MANPILLVSDTQGKHAEVAAVFEDQNKKYPLKVILDENSIVEAVENTEPKAIILCQSLDSIFQYLNVIKRNYRTRYLPVLVIADQWDNNKLTKAVQAGISDIILRPFNPEELLLRINLAITQNRAVTKYRKLIKNYKQLEQLSHIASKSSNAIAIISPKGKIIWVNEGFTEMYEFPLHEFKKNFEESIYNPLYNEHFHYAIKKNISDKSTVTYESFWKTGSGSGKWIQTSLTPLFNDSTGRITRVIAIETDITEKKQAENRLEEQNEYLLKVTKRLETTNEILENQRIEIEEEKTKSEELLLNILPYPVAKQLKSKGTARLKTYKLVSVLFTDFVGFTELTQNLSKDELIRELSEYFDIFENIIEDHYIEKIKTIGDAFMCAGGLPLSNRSNPIDVVLAGLKMQEQVEARKQKFIEDGKPLWEIRLGIHTGEVIAGVIGKKKFAYDIWGDTVNTASRMETAGGIGKVNISGSTYEHIKSFFDCTYRGKIEVKHKGDMEMYFVNRLLPEFSADAKGIEPNEKFIKILSTY